MSTLTETAEDFTGRAARGSATLRADAASTTDPDEQARLQSKADAVDDAARLLRRYLDALPADAGWAAFGNALRSLSDLRFRADGNRADDGYRQGLAVAVDWLRAYQPDDQAGAQTDVA